LDLKQQIEELLSVLNPGSIIGVDIGTHTVKVAEVSGNIGKFKLEKFAVAPLPEGTIIEDDIQKPELILECIAKAMESAKIKSKSICFGLFGQNTMTKRMSVPDGSNDEIRDHVMWEAEQYIPFGADESEIDFSVIGNTEGGGKDILVVAARTDLIEKFQSLFKELNYNPKVVDLNILALSNVIESTALFQNPDLNEGVVVIDYGAQSIKLLVYRLGGPVFTKDLPFGGTLITEEIQRQMAVSYEEAEDLKTTVDEKGRLPQEVLTIVQSQIEEQVNEIKKSLNFYIAAGATDQVSNCFLTGGGARMIILQEMLQSALGIRVEIFDPFKYGLKLANSLSDDQEQIATIGAVAIGLGLRNKRD
jgi:type IV pilus assembly protein PilM